MNEIELQTSHAYFLQATSLQKVRHGCLQWLQQQAGHAARAVQQTSEVSHDDDDDVGNDDDDVMWL